LLSAYHSPATSVRLIAAATKTCEQQRDERQQDTCNAASVACSQIIAVGGNQVPPAGLVGGAGVVLVALAADPCHCVLAGLCG
jgi:hypothetical protein